MELYENLKSLKKHNKLTKTELCKRLSLAFSTYNNWEIKNSTPSIPHLCMLADFYGVSVDYLVGHNVKEIQITKMQTDLLQKYDKLSDKERRLVNILIDSIKIINDEKELPDITASVSSPPSNPENPVVQAACFCGSWRIS